MERENQAQMNYKVLKASREQVDLFIDTRYTYLQEKRNIVITFIAVDENENILGHIIMEEKNVPSPLNGTDWFIWNIFTINEFRRQGIGSALLKETIKQAEQANIRHLQGSCTNTPAHLFWFRHGFCFQKYGQKIDDVNHPQEHGNYPHIIFYRIDRIVKNNHGELDSYSIIKAEKERLNCIFDEYIFDKVPFFKDKKQDDIYWVEEDDIFGFAAIDEDGKTVGFIIACPYELGAPLGGIQWLVPYIFVNPEFRHRGIGSALLKQMTESAKEANVTQIGLINLQELDEEATAFLYNNNFGICVWYIARTQDGKNPVSAALRIL